MFYYQHHIGDFIKDTSNLDDHQLVTYMRMIWVYYTDESPFDDDLEDIAFAVRSDEKTVRLLLKHFFSKVENKWHHKRCDREISEYHSKSEKARNSANARWKNANGMRTHSERNANERVFDANQEPITNNQEPITKNHKQVTNNKNTGAFTVDAAFDDFWNAYDKKVAKPAAEKAWKKIKPDDDLLITILQSARKYVQSTPNKQYRKDPATWLNNQCWNDEIVENIPQKTQTQLNNEALVRSLGLDKVYGKQNFIEEVQDVAAFTPRLG